MSRPSPRRLLLPALLAAALLPALPARSEPAVGREEIAPQGTSVLVDEEEGEEAQIRARREWFLSTRRAGLTGSPGEMAELRRKAALQVQDALARQRAARLAGTDAPLNQWVSVGPAPSRFGGWAFGDVAGRITGIARSSTGSIYISSAAGGVWRTDNDGLSWTNVFETAGTQPTGAVAVDPTNEAVLWVGTGDFVTGCEGYFGIGLLRSDDGGLTWQPRNGTAPTSLEDLSNFSDVVIDPRDPSHLVVGGNTRGCSSGAETGGALFRTTDGGLTWTKKLTDMSVHEIAQSPTAQNTWWASTSQGVWKSTDNAATWVKQTASGLPSSNTGRTELAVAPSDGNTVYVLFESGAFWRTTNGGSSWSQMSSGACDGQCWYNMTLAVHRTNPAIVYRGTILIFKSTNGGANWTTLTNGWGGSQQVHQDTHALLVDPDVADGFYVGGDGGMWRSADGGATFQNMNGGLGLFLFYAVDAREDDASVVCGGAQDNSSLARTTSDVWDLQAVTGDGFVCLLDPQDPDYSYITSYPGSYPSVSRSTNGVLGSYSGITGPGSGIVSGDRCNWVTPYTLDPNQPSVLLLGTHRVYRSADHGSNWVMSSPSDLTGGNGTLNVVEFNRSDSRIAYAGSGSGKVWRSADNGITFADITANLGPGWPVNDLAGDPEDPTRALAVVGGFNHPHLWEWTAARGTWVALGPNLPNVPANSVFLKTSSEVYVGNDVGVFRSTDGGATFAPFMDGLPQGLVVTDLKYGRGTSILTAGTYGRGAYQASITPPGPIVLYRGIVLPLAPLDGDGDANVEPGETWSVTPILRNAGGEPASGVRARLVPTTPGVTVLGTGFGDFGDLAPGEERGSLAPYAFRVDPGFPCGGVVTFDIVEITSASPARGYADRPAAFTVTVVDAYESPVPETLLDEDFDPNPGSGWTHNGSTVYEPGCLFNRKDEWKYASKDAAHGSSWHCGNGPGGSYSNYDDSWLYHGGKDSANGPGLVLPADAIGATLTLVHWYSTEAGYDGGIVAVDGTDDNSDAYTPLSPAGGYPGTLAGGFCNAQGGKAAFTGSSGGWVTSTFDLSGYLGRRIWLAFVFGSDRKTTVHEGWYVDRVQVEVRRQGAALCQVTPWAGQVPPTARFDLVEGDLRATWDPSCTAASTSGQAYSVQAGDLAALRGGTYTHAPVDGRCDLASPATFAPGLGDEYYLVVAGVGGGEGSAGTASDGTERPKPGGACGPRRDAACP